MYTEDLLTEALCVQRVIDKNQCQHVQLLLTLKLKVLYALLRFINNVYLLLHYAMCDVHCRENIFSSARI